MLDALRKGKGSWARAVLTRASAQVATAATADPTPSLPRAVGAAPNSERAAGAASMIRSVSWGCAAAEGSAPRRSPSVSRAETQAPLVSRGPTVWASEMIRAAKRRRRAACAVTCSTIAFRLAHAGWAASRALMTVTASAFLSFKRANPAVKRSPVRKGFGAASPTRPRARPARTSTTVMRVTIARSARARAGATRARPAKWRPGPARVSVRRMPTLARPATGVSRVVGVGVVRSTAMT